VVVAALPGLIEQGPKEDQMPLDTEHHEQTELLKAIWSEVKTAHQSLGRRIDETETSLGRRIDETETNLGRRIDETNLRIDETNLRFDRHVEMTQMRFDLVDASLRELAGQQLMLTRYVKTSLERHGAAIDLLETRVGGHDAALEDLDDLKERVERIESRGPIIPSP
jgi:hypothetical protein